MDTLARIVLIAILLWVFMEQSNRSGYGLFMGRAPCICDEDTVYVVQGRNKTGRSQRAKLLRQLIPGLVLILLVFALVQILEASNK